MREQKKKREKEDTREQRYIDIQSWWERGEDPVDVSHIFFGSPSIEFVTFFSNHTLTLSWMIMVLIWVILKSFLPDSTHLTFFLSPIDLTTGTWPDSQPSLAQPVVHKLSVMYSNLLKHYAATLWVGLIDLPWCHPHSLGWTSRNFQLSFIKSGKGRKWS